MKTTVSLLTLCILSACAGTALPTVTGPTEVVQVSRDFLVRGTRDGNRIIRQPKIGRLIYDMTCGPAPDGASLAARQAQASDVMTQATNGLGYIALTGSLTGSDRRQINRVMVPTFNCSVNPVASEIVSEDQVDVLRFVVENNIVPVR